MEHYSERVVVFSEDLDETGSAVPVVLPGVVITLAADGKEVSTEMVRFIKEALFIKTGDGA